MAIQNINVGATANDGTGDPLRNSFIKCNDNFTDLDTTKQDTLVSGTNIKTLEGQSLLGSGNIDLTKSDVGLGNVDNTSDLNKPISTATQTALNAKIGGSGTTNYVSKFTASGSIGNSLIFDNGSSVGIGTTNPTGIYGASRVLQVDGPFDTEIQSKGSGAWVRANSINTFQGGFGGFQYLQNGVENFGIVSSGAGTNTMLLTTGGSEKMRITSGGNVGIGTTNPQAKLHSNSDILTGYFQNGTNGIYDALKITNNTASNNLSGNSARIQFYNNANNSTNLLGASIRSVNVDYGWASDLILSSVQNNGYASQTVNDAIYIKSNGNVGIGTASPTSKLHVVGLPEYATNALAIAGGLTAGAFYHTAGVLKLVI